MNEIITVQDLETLKKHEIFEAEVLTGKVGGLATGADIDYATNQATGQTQKTLPAILRDIGFEPASFDFTTGGTLGVDDRNKAVLWPLADGGDGDWYNWEGALPKVVPAASTPYTTGGVVDGAWRAVGDITLRGDLAAAGGSSIVGFIQAGAGSVPSTAQSKMREWVSVKDFGAIGDGVADDTVAFQNCFTAFPHHDVTIPNGTYKLTGTLTKASGMLVGHGRASILVFDGLNGANGIVFNPVLPQTMSGASDLTILAKTNNGGKAFSTPQNSDQYFVLRSAFKFTNLYISGYTKPVPGTQNAFETIETWLCGIEVGDGVGADITNLQCYGSYRSDTDPTIQAQSCAIRLKAAFTLLTAQLSHLTICNTYRGIEIGAGTFWHILQFDISHTFDGVYQIEAGALNECILSDGNVNAQHIGIYFFNIGGRRIKNIIVRRHRFGWKSATHDWYGLKLDDCNSTWISKFEAEPSEVDGAFLGTQYNMRLFSCGGTMIDNVLVGATCDRGITLDDCAQTVLNNIESFQNQPTAVLFDFINNTRNASIGLYAVVSSFTGTVLSKDETTMPNAIQMMNQQFDFQTTGSGFFGLTRSNAPTDQRKWATVLGTNSINRTAQNEAGSNTNYELVTRTGTTIDEIQWRAGQLRIGSGGPIIKGGSGSPEGIVTAPPGSLWLSTSDGVGLYHKKTGTGNTGWVAA